MLRADVGTCRQATPLSQPVVNLLPSQDPFLLGYMAHDRYGVTRYADQAFDQTGHVTSTILLNGQVIGVWDLIAENCLLKLYLFQSVNDDCRQAIEAAAQQIGRFVCHEVVAVHWCANMPPLTRQPPGSVTSPLRNC